MYTTRTALITGASAGIGEAFAEEYARKGCDVILTARRGGRLKALSQRLTQRYGVRAHSFEADLALPQAPEILHQQITAQGLAVDILVNNAGYGVPGNFTESAWQVHSDFIQVMCTAVAHLTHLCLPRMVDQRWGHVINVASVAALLPGNSQHTLYAASKAFCVKFSESLSLEVQSSGVHVTAACPGFTYSEFHDVLGVRPEMDALPKFLWLNATEVARQSITAVERGQVLCINGGIYKVIVGLVKIMPYRLSRWLTSRRPR